ncbi:hypothetical protein F3H66_22270 [Serratia marcescens]|uniref:hypothetical protein n=1 Tax=Serratia marcescens TaxID=615 RepID=UPI0018816B04|nr:hypothetical protein [Serratia marcescens]MBE8816267.1 hypothetical protein [Serratia marcescens]
MKDRPVIFNSEMVRAILDGRKTQTRRVIANVSPDNCIPLQKPTKTKDGIYTHVMDAPGHGLCPFGRVGDRLWVRETWGVVSHDFDENERIIDWVPDRPATAIHEMPFGNGYYSGHAIYAADGEFTWGDDDGHGERSCWKPSIHMPREACRILLEITAVRVERLTMISHEDAIAEGAPRASCCRDPRHGFIELWESIYGKESIATNPWVWVIEFRRVGDSAREVERGKSD